jgi:hypothetical protein
VTHLLGDGYAALEDVADRLEADPALVEVFRALSIATSGGPAVVLLVAELDAPTWREHTAHLPGVTIVSSSLMLPGQARVKA